MSESDSLYRWTWSIVICAVFAYWGFAFFFWHFMGWLTPFIAPSLWLPIYALLLFALVLAVALPIRRWRTRHAASLLPLGLLVALVVAAQFVDFTHLWLRANFALGRTAREKIVQQIAAGELRPNVAHNSQLIRLPAVYREISLGGGEVIVEREKILFFTFRGILDHFAGFVYSPDDSPPTSGDFAGDFFIIEKMADRWYYVSAR
jgi:hypothetical protein